MLWFTVVKGFNMPDKKLPPKREVGQVQNAIGKGCRGATGVPSSLAL